MTTLLMHEYPYFQMSHMRIYVLFISTLIKICISSITSSGSLVAWLPVRLMFIVCSQCNVKFYSILSILFYFIRMAHFPIIFRTAALALGQKIVINLKDSFQWRHNGRDGISNHEPHQCLLNRLFMCRSKKYQSSASLALVRGIHRWPVNSAHKWTVVRKMFPFDDVIILGKIVFHLTITKQYQAQSMCMILITMCCM